MPVMVEVDQYQDIIDSRDVIERIRELGDMIEDPDWVVLDEEEEEFKALSELASECEGYTEDWKYGATLIRDSYFKSYAQELAEDIGAIDPNASWPAYCIDWERAASDLQMDYTSVEFRGVTYWVR